MKKRIHKTKLKPQEESKEHMYYVMNVKYLFIMIIKCKQTNNFDLIISEF